MTKLRALIKSWVRKALEGDIRAANVIMSFAIKALAGADEASAADALSADDQEIVDTFVDRELKRRLQSEMIKDLPSAIKDNLKD